MKTEVSVVKDNVSNVVNSLRDLIGKQVLVGIPDVRAGRNEPGEVNNAMLGYIHEFGSPANNIPARPFLIPGVKKVEASNIRHLRIATKAALEGDRRKVFVAMNAAGVTASNSARNAITHGNFVPLKPGTIAGRARARGDKTRRASEIDYLKFVARGVDPAAAQAEVGIKPLINTAQLLRSITYVIRNVAERK